MAVKTIFELFDFLPGSNGSFKIDATDKEGNTVSIISSANSKRYMIRKYGTRRYALLTGQTGATASDAESAFIEDYTLWIANRQKNIDLQYQALFDYPFNPIENYDRYEDETINKDISTTYGKKSTLGGSDSVTYGKKNTEGGSDSVTYGKKNTESGSDSLQHGKKETLSGSDRYTHDTTDTLTKSGSETHATSKTGFNSPNSYTPESQDKLTYTARTDKHVIDTDDSTTYGKVTTDSGTDTTTFGKIDTLSGTDTTNYGKTDTLSGTDSTTYGKTDTLSGSDSTDDDTERESHIHGNIGVTTASAMIGETVELYIRSFAEMLIDNFIDDYTYYS